MLGTDATSPTVAGIGRRLAAMAYETLLLTGVLAVVFLLPQLAVGAALGHVLPAWILLPHAVVVVFGYFLWFWRHGGQTLAMKTWKLHLVDARTGAMPSLRQLVARQLLSWPSVLLYGVGLVWALFDRDRQFLHDRLAGTRLVFSAARPTTASRRQPA